MLAWGKCCHTHSSFFILQIIEPLPSKEENLISCWEINWLTKLLSWEPGLCKYIFLWNFDFLIFFSPLLILFLLVCIFIYFQRLLNYQENSISNRFPKAISLISEKWKDQKTFSLKILNVLLLNNWYCTFAGTKFIPHQTHVCTFPQYTYFLFQ